MALVGIGGAEFLCAQTPYSMSRLMIGASYGTMAVFCPVGYEITQLFTSKIISRGKGLSVVNFGA